jgi:hypothetical protein
MNGFINFLNFQIYNILIKKYVRNFKYTLNIIERYFQTHK